MSGTINLWDRPGDPSIELSNVLYWRRFDKSPGSISVPSYIESNAERIRSKYLAFIHDLGESKINAKRIIDHLDMGNGFSFWWMTLLAEKCPLKSPGIYDALRLLALEEILIEKKPSRFVCNSANRDTATAIKVLCKNLSIDFSWSAYPKKKALWTSQRIYRFLPYPLQGFLSLIKYLKVRSHLRKLRVPAWFSGDMSILLCSYFIHLDPDKCAKGRFYSKLWEALPIYIQDKGWRINWLQHFLTSALIPNTEKGVKWLRNFNSDPGKQGYHAFIDSYLSLGIILRVVKHWLWLNFISWRLRSIPSAFSPNDSAVYLWPVLSHDWKTAIVGNVGIRNLVLYELFNAALKSIPRQTAGLYICENQGWERAFLHAWHHYGHGQIIGVQHATAPFWHLYYFTDPRSINENKNCAVPLPHLFAVNGPVAWKEFINGGYPETLLTKVEALRYQNIAKAKDKKNKSAKKRIGSKLQVSEMVDINVLVLGDMIPSSMHNFLQMIETAMKSIPAGYSFSFKPHPGYDVNLSEYPALHMTKVNGALDLILSEYDIALSVNSTSAFVDAYQAGLPVIVTLDGAELNLSPLRNQPDVYFVSTPKELAGVILNLKDHTNTYPANENYFFLDEKMPRWNNLFSTLKPMGSPDTIN